jgi:hypothetical protein
VLWCGRATWTGNKPASRRMNWPEGPTLYLRARAGARGLLWAVPRLKRIAPTGERAGGPLAGDAYPSLKLLRLDLTGVENM